MNNIQKAAHAEGLNLVAKAFNNGERFNADQAVAWLNLCLSKDSCLESLAVVDRDANGEIAQVKKIEATTAELCGYRLTGIFSGLEAVRASLQQRSVSLTFALSAPASTSGNQ